MLVTHVMNRQNTALYKETLRIVDADDSDCLLDIGCGNGYVLSLLAHQCKASLAGVDISASMVKSATRRNRQLVAQGRLTIRSGEAASLPFAEQSFTKAFTINTVYFWPDVDAVMAEIKRVLKPDGVFVNALYSNEFLSSHPHTETGYRFHTPDDLIRAAQDAGFVVSTVPVLDGVAYCIVCQVPSL